MVLSSRVTCEIQPTERERDGGRERELEGEEEKEHSNTQDNLFEVIMIQTQ